MLNNDSLQQLKELKVTLNAQKEVAEGIVKGTQHRYGFLVVNAKQQIFIPPEEMLKVFPQDRIKVVVRKDKKGKPFAEVETLVNTELNQFVGRYVIKGNAHFVEPDVPQLSRWIFIPPKHRQEAQHGDFIQCQLLRHPFKTGKAQAKVLSVIGNEKTVGIEASYAIVKHGLPELWPEKVERQLASSLEDVLKKQVAGREDLSALPFVTIDAPSTLDMDDALYAEKSDSGWTLYVAIADPTAVIEPNSPIEQEASQRATSAYLLGKRISMLPEVISHHFCSLVANELRLATVCKIDIPTDGSLAGFQFSEAVICSKAKLNYAEVAQYLDNPAAHGELKEKYPELVDKIDVLANVHTALHKNRAANAILIEDNADYRIILNEQKKIDNIEKIERNTAHRLVEECMVAANRCAAEFLKQHDNSGIYITHRGFRRERLKDVKRIVNEQYPEYEVGELDNLEGFRKLIHKVEATENPLPVRTIFSRTFERSQLSLIPQPHFGMGIECYTTFTSPIRRYTDFLIQRAIKARLKGDNQYVQDAELVQQLQEQLNAVRACSQEIEQWLKCQYIENKTDQVFEAKICQINSSHLTVRLDTNGIEGLVSIKELPEKYRYDPLYLIHSSKKQSFKLNDALTVKLVSVEPRQKNIIFSIVSNSDSDHQNTTPPPQTLDNNKQS